MAAGGRRPELRGTADEGPSARASRRAAVASASLPVATDRPSRTAGKPSRAGESETDGAKPSRPLRMVAGSGGAAFARGGRCVDPGSAPRHESGGSPVVQGRGRPRPRGARESARSVTERVEHVVDHPCGPEDAQAVECASAGGGGVAVVADGDLLVAGLRVSSPTSRARGPTRRRASCRPVPGVSAVVSTTESVRGRPPGVRPGRDGVHHCRRHPGPRAPANALPRVRRRSPR